MSHNVWEYKSTELAEREMQKEVIAILIHYNNFVIGIPGHF